MTILSLEQIIQLKTKGYTVVKVLDRNQVKSAKTKFIQWFKACPKSVQNLPPHGVYGLAQAGHTEMAWYIRTLPNVRGVFEELWGTKDLLTSFDGFGYNPATDKPRRNTVWLHSDQSPESRGVQCYQAFVALTSNSASTFNCVPGSHFDHQEIFAASKKPLENWQPLDTAAKAIWGPKSIDVAVNRGDMVIWDSRLLHQNKYSPEVRLVQYVCMKPRQGTSKATLCKRRKYFKAKRTTSHWPYPVKVNGLQPQVWGDKSKLIDYSALPQIDLEDLKGVESLV